MKKNQLMLVVILLNITLGVSSETNDTTQQIQPGVTLYDTPVYKDPDRHSSLLYQLNKDTSLFIKERHNSWYKVEVTDKQQGWLRLLSVRYVGTPKQSFLGEITDISSDIYNVQRSGAIATTGVRGIDEEDFKVAKPDFEMLEVIRSKKITEAEVTNFASQGSLWVKNINIPTDNTIQKEKSDE